jgi:hypothetical protein
VKTRCVKKIILFKLKSLAKKTILFCTLSFLATLTFAQTKEKENQQSNAEKFSERAGTLIQKEFINIGDIKKCELNVIHFTDLISNQKTSALRFEYDYEGSSTSDTKRAVLDADEIDGLIKSIKIIQEKILPSTPSNYSEVSFRSRSGFEAGCYSKKDNWSAYMKLEMYDSNSYVFIDKDDLGQLLTLLENAKSKL